MSALVVLAILCGTMTCLFMWIRSSKRYTQLPSGPKGWPIVGNALQQDPLHTHLTWFKWAEEYGDVFTINNFGKPMVVCNSFAAIREMLVEKTNDFVGRAQLFVYKHVTDGANGVVMSDYSPQWSRMKKLILTNIKMYGDGLKHLESLMLEIIEELITDIQATGQQPFDPLVDIQNTLAKIVTMKFLGWKFDRHESDFQQLLKDLDQIQKDFAPSVWFTIVNLFPWIRFLPFKYCQGLDNYRLSHMRDWIPRQIQKRRKFYNPDRVGCVLDAFLLQHEEDKTNQELYPIEKKHLIGVGFDFMNAGMATSTATLYSLLAVLTAMPNIQKKAREEVDLVLEEHHPKLKDRENMPYFQAMLEEVLRYSVIVNDLPHKAIKDSDICGHFIPKDTEIWPNIWYLCHEVTFWKDPWTFKPERFLDDNGNFLSADDPKRKRVMVFGAGRRACPGEHFARNRIFLIMTSLLQKFVFIPSADDEMPKHDPRTFPHAINLMPQMYKLKAIPRSEFDFQS